MTAWVLYGPPGPGTHSLDDAPMLSGDSTLTPSSALAAGDLDGDGFDDLGVGDVGNDIYGTDLGGAWILYGGER